MKRAAILFAALPFLVPETSSQAADKAVTPHFVEETATSGIDHRYMGDWQYMVGGGAAAFDCNDDGFSDVLLAGGEGKAQFFVNESTRGGPLTFKTQESGLELEAVTGAYPLDIDSDGKMDVVLLRVGENVLMRGEGQCRFTRANEAWKFEGGDGWSTAYSAMWEKEQRWPTVAIGNYIDRAQEMEPWGSCTDNVLYRPAPDQSSFAAPLPLKPSYCPLSILFTDWNNSGLPDLRVSNDREYYEGGQEQMWRIRPGEAPVLYAKEEGWKYLRIWGMGIANYDLNGDGYQEYFLTSMADNKLQTLAEVPKDGTAAKPTYADVAYPKGVTAHRPFMGEDLNPSTAWHTEFQDVNNDGLVDLFIAKGNVAKMPDFALKDPNNLLVQQPDGKFIEAAADASVASTLVSRGGALVDFNLDGLIDILVVNRWEKAQVWRNVTEKAGNWIAVKLEQDGANRDAIGAWVEVKAGGHLQRREIVSGGGHASGHSGWIHTGLGGATAAEVRVRWPGGNWSEPYAVAANGFSILKRDAKAAEGWTPGR